MTHHTKGTTMKRALFFSALVIGAAALASGIGGQIATTSGSGCQYAYTGKQRLVAMACPYAVVAWKSGAGAGGQGDAGRGGITAPTTSNGTVTDFTTLTDPIIVGVGGGDRIGVCNVDGGAAACSFSAVLSE